ncbi:MAG: carbon storage regulator [Proteobacteria bacterium]|nr:carbon storage regulator [Pseudomonadota bacterium]
MLYLMRKIGESIVINGDIEVRVVEVKGRAVKLGFEFPPTATVLRKEIHDRIIEENRAAAGGLSADDLSAMSGLSMESTTVPAVKAKPKPGLPKDK